MIIKEISIKNFRSYYGNNTFHLSEGLTLIIGGNGDGKTTFFEALEWLFNTSGENTREAFISEKRKSELEIGEKDEVTVSIKFEHNGLKELLKSFTFERRDAKFVSIKDYKFIGYVDGLTERYHEKGEVLLEKCFDTVIRKYCLFKGESELNVFDNETALKTLVETFSGIRQFDTLVDMTTEFERKSANAYTQEAKKDTKTAKRAKELEVELINCSKRIHEIQLELSDKERAISDYSTKIENLEKYQETSEYFQEIKSRIIAKDAKATRLKGSLLIDYNAELLDNYWILRSFPTVLNEFQKKASALSREKRKMEDTEAQRIAEEKGAQKAIESIRKLANGATALPWNLPDKETLQEMIDEEICKVCGRPAPKGTEAHNFMVKKLNDYLRHVEEEAIKKQKEAEENVLFVNDFIDELHTQQIQLSGNIESEIAGKKNEISEQLTFIADRKAEYDKVLNELNEAKAERDRLFMQIPGITAEMLDKQFSDFKGFFETKAKAERRCDELNRQLDEANILKDKINREFSELNPENTQTLIYQRVNIAFKIIMEAFINAKKKNVAEFLTLLEDESNNYFKKLNENDFSGIIKIIPARNDSARIELHSANGTIIDNPGGAQKTTMYMSVLFAISNITTLKREQDYPLIFDAPTSSFEDYKEDVFYNVIDKIDKQCIIVTKDLLITDPETKIKTLNEEKIKQLTCSVYRISKAENFNELDLSTIQTKITPIK